MTKWEYAELTAWDNDRNEWTFGWHGPTETPFKEAEGLVERLNQAGQQGWEAVGYSTTVRYQGYGTSCLLRRPLS
jgi:hypothetical protein